MTFLSATNDSACPAMSLQETLMWSNPRIAELYKVAERATGPFARSLIRQAGVYQVTQTPLVVLDNACGTGVVSAQLYETLEESAKEKMQLTCADFSEHMVKAVTQRIEENHWNGATARLVDAQVRHPPTTLSTPTPTRLHSDPKSENRLSVQPLHARDNQLRNNGHARPHRRPQRFVLPDPLSYPTHELPFSCLILQNATASSNPAAQSPSRPGRQSAGCPSSAPRSPSCPPPSLASQTRKHLSRPGALTLHPIPTTSCLESNGTTRHPSPTPLPPTASETYTSPSSARRRKS